MIRYLKIALVWCFSITIQCAFIAYNKAYAIDELSIDADASSSFDFDELASAPFDWGSNTDGTGASGEPTNGFDLQVNATGAILVQDLDQIGDGTVAVDAISFVLNSQTLTLDDSTNDDSPQTVAIAGNIGLNAVAQANLIIVGEDTDAAADIMTVNVNGSVNLGTGILTLTADSINTGNDLIVTVSGDLTASTTTLNASGSNATLSFDGGIPQTIASAIDGGGAGEGTVNIDAGSSITTGSTWGGGNGLNSITLTNAGNLTTGAAITATVIDVGAASTLTSGALITGAVALSGAGGTLALGNGFGVTGTVDNTTFGPGIGILTSASTAGNTSTITGNLGGTDSLSSISLTSSGTFSFGGTVNSAAITATTAGGTLDFDGNVTGDITLGADATVELATSTNITGTLDNTSGANGAGALIIESSGGTNNISGVVGGTNSLRLITLNGTGTASFNSTVSADTINFNSSGTLSFSGDVTTASRIDFVSSAGTIALGDNVSITGSIDASGGGAGILTSNSTAGNTSTVSGNIGATNSLGSISLTSSGTLSFNGLVNASTITATTTGGTLDFNDDVTGNITLGADAIVDLAGGRNIIGNIDNISGADDSGALLLDTTGNNTISGTVGETNSLRIITLGGTGVATFSSPVNTEVIQFANTASVLFSSAVTSTNGIDFMSNNGSVAFADNVNPTFSIISTGSENGTVTFLGSSLLTGQIGFSSASGASLVNVSGAGDTVTITGDSFFGTLSTVANSNLSFIGNATAATIINNEGSITLAEGTTLTSADYSGSGSYNIPVIDDGDNILNAADFGHLSSAGAIDLGAESINFAFSGPPVIGTTTLATGGAAAIAPLNVTDDSFILRASVTENGNNLDLTVAPDAAGVATTVNAINTGAVFDTLTNTGNPQLLAIINNILTVTTSQQLDELLESTISTVDGGPLVAGIAIANQMFSFTKLRLASLSNKNGITGMAAGNSNGGVNFWAQGFGMSADQDRRNHIDGYDAKTRGAALGMDTTNQNNDIAVGAAISYGATEIDSLNANKTNTEVDSYQIVLYGEHKVGRITKLSGQLGYIWGNVNAVRHNVGGVSGLTSTGEYNTHQIVARTELSREYLFGSYSLLRPFINANYTYFNANSYTETGAGGASLIVDSESVNILELGLGTDAAWKYQLNNKNTFLQPSISASLLQDLLDDKIEATNKFKGGGSAFRVKGFDTAHTSINLGAGLEYVNTERLRISVDYNYKTKADFDSHSGFVKAALKF